MIQITLTEPSWKSIREYPIETQAPSPPNSSCNSSTGSSNVVPPKAMVWRFSKELNTEPT